MSAPSTPAPRPAPRKPPGFFSRLGDFLRVHKSWQYAIIGLILASAVASLAWYYTVGQREAISVSTVSYDIVDARHTRFTFDVTSPSDYRVSCDVQAVSVDNRQVGVLNDVIIAPRPGGGRLVRTTVTVPTTEKPNVVQVSQCIKQ